MKKNVSCCFRIRKGITFVRKSQDTFHFSKVNSDFEMKTARGIGGIILTGGNRTEEAAEKSTPSVTSSTTKR